MSAKIQVNRKAIFTGHQSSVYSLAAGAGEGQFFSADGNGWIVNWDLGKEADGKLVAQMHKSVYTIHYAPEQQLLWAGAINGDIARIDRNNNVRVLKAHSGPVFGFTQFSNEIFLSYGGDGQIIFWNPDGDIVHSFYAAKSIIRSVAVTETGLIAGVTGGMLYGCNSDGTGLREIYKFEGSVFSIASDVTDNSFFAAGRDAHIHHVFPYDDQVVQNSIAAHLQSIHCLKHNGNEWLGSSSMDKTIKLWDIKTMDLLKVIDKAKFGLHSSSVNNLLWLDANTLVSASDDRQIGVFEIKALE